MSGDRLSSAQLNDHSQIKMGARPKKGVSDSTWYKNVKDLQKFVNDEDKDYLSIYEKCIRSTPELWDSLLNLENKVLGCWCEPSQPCHADVLIKLINEKKNDEIQHQFGIETGKYGKYEICIDLTDEE